MPRKTARCSRRGRRASACFNEAAARCRGKLDSTLEVPGVLDAASMRPRPDAAENHAPSVQVDLYLCGFNEAAARCRGKHQQQAGAEEAEGRASMRPRPDAAENGCAIR